MEIFSALVEFFSALMVFSALLGFSALVECSSALLVLVFSALPGFSALMEIFSALLGFSAPVEFFSALLVFSALLAPEVHFSALMESDTCFLVRRRLHCHFLGVRLTSADGARGGGGGIDSGGGCEAVLPATCAAAAVGGICGCGDALAKAICDSCGGD